MPKMPAPPHARPRKMLMDRWKQTESTTLPPLSETHWKVLRSKSSWCRAKGGGFGCGGVPRRAWTSMGVSIARRVFIRVSAWRPSDDKGNFEADFDEIPHEEDTPATHCSGRSSGRGTIPALQRMSIRQCQGIAPTTPLFANAPSTTEQVKRPPPPHAQLLPSSK